MSESVLPGAKSLSWSKVTKRQQQISLRKGKSLMLSTDWVGWKCPKKSPIYPNCSPDVYLTSTSSPRTLGFCFWTSDLVTSHYPPTLTPITDLLMENRHFVWTSDLTTSNPFPLPRSNGTSSCTTSQRLHFTIGSKWSTCWLDSLML